MSLSDWLIHADTQWISIEDNPDLLAIELDHWLNDRAIHEADLAAGDGDPVITQASIAFATVVIDKLIAQGKRLARARLQPTAEVIALDDMRSRFEAAKKLPPDEVVERISGQWLTQKHRTGDSWTTCPLPGHEDRTASFHIDDTGRWYCFGCHRGGGDVVSFAATYLGKSQMSGLILLEELFGR